MALYSSSSDTSSYSTIGDHLRFRKPRNPISSTTDPNPPRISSIMETTRCKSAISSLLLSTFSNNNNSSSDNTQKTKKYSSKGSTLLGFGCTAQPEVSVPAVIRSSADWEDKREDNKNSKKKMKNKKKKKHQQQQQQQQLQLQTMDESVVQDLWCGADSAASSAPVDCVRPLSSRNKIDLDKLHHHHHTNSSRERGSYSFRQRVNAEQFGGLDLDSTFDAPHIGPDVFEARHYHHLRNRSPEGLAEILMFQNGLLMSRRSGGLDRYRDWRLDVDSMTYEELLELGERIGHVSTGLEEDKIGRCLRKMKLSVVDELSSQSYPPEVEPKCSICQEDYEADDEMGKLECGHAYHLHCIQQWLARKNACPVCKAEASYQ